MIKSQISDREVERWFERCGGDIADASVAQIHEVALWLPIIGIPANDRGLRLGLVTAKL